MMKGWDIPGRVAVAAEMGDGPAEFEQSDYGDRSERDGRYRKTGPQRGQEPAGEEERYRDEEQKGALRGPRHIYQGDDGEDVDPDGPPLPEALIALGRFGPGGDDVLEPRDDEVEKGRAEEYGGDQARPVRKAYYLLGDVNDAENGDELDDPYLRYAQALLMLFGCLLRAHSRSYPTISGASYTPSPSGTVNVTVVPSPTELSMLMSPFMIAMTLFTSARPSPIPSGEDGRSLR